MISYFARDKENTKRNMLIYDIFLVMFCENVINMDNLWHSQYFCHISACWILGPYFYDIFSDSSQTSPVKKISQRSSKVDQNLTFWIIAPMVDQRPRMRRSYRNTSILILTCLIWRSDEPRMSNLVSIVEYFMFSPF
jgi:hypothetical protein